MDQEAVAAIQLAESFQDSGRSAEAIDVCRQALARGPDPGVRLPLLNKLGILLRESGQLDEAIASYQQALKLEPDQFDLLTNLGIAYRSAGEHAKSIDCCRQALSARPNDPKAHMNLATSLLTAGEYAEGWQEYQWRLRLPDCAVRNFPRPMWDGRTLDDQTVFVHSEQGFGDTFQFVRYLPLVKQRGATVVFGCQRPLTPLLGSLPGVDLLVSEGQRIPRFDWHCPLMSLPYYCHTTTEDEIPDEVPYLQADPQLVACWGRKLDEYPGRKIGVCWQGRRSYGHDRSRSIRLDHYEILSRATDVTLISLQKGPGAEQLALPEAPQAVIHFGDQLDSEHGAFMDTAAIMMNLDLVIAPNTAGAHLAGALGVPVWVVLDYESEWRWLKDRQDSPWYPTARLFRQKRPGDWPEVFQRIARELAQ